MKKAQVKKKISSAEESPMWVYSKWRREIHKELRTNCVQILIEREKGKGKREMGQKKK